MACSTRSTTGWRCSTGRDTAGEIFGRSAHKAGLAWLWWGDGNAALFQRGQNFGARARQWRERPRGEGRGANWGDRAPPRYVHHADGHTKYDRHTRIVPRWIGQVDSLTGLVHQGMRHQSYQHIGCDVDAMAPGVHTRPSLPISRSMSATVRRSGSRVPSASS